MLSSSQKASLPPSAMANLIVRNVDEAIVQALKERASRHGISAEAEHRKILEQALLHPPKKSFAEVLRLIPNVGNDTDFERLQDDTAPNVFA
jgi:plasmid stability protein